MDLSHTRTHPYTPRYPLFPVLIYVTCVCPSLSRESITSISGEKVWQGSHPPLRLSILNIDGICNFAFKFLGGLMKAWRYSPIVRVQSSRNRKIQRFTVPCKAGWLGARGAEGGQLQEVSLLGHPSCRPRPLTLPFTLLYTSVQFANCVRELLLNIASGLA
jgi:hypothetical protein